MKILPRKNIYPFFLDVLDKGYILIEGIKEKSIEIARKLLNKNTSKEEISEITGLDKKEIDKIEKEIISWF